MTPELGHFALALALALALAQTFFGLMGGWKRRVRWMDAAHSAVMGQTIFVAAVHPTSARPPPIDSSQHKKQKQQTFRSLQKSQKSQTIKKVKNQKKSKIQKKSKKI